MSKFAEVIRAAWLNFSEEEKYITWSNYLEFGGGFIDYSEYCDYMDGLVK